MPELPEVQALADVLSERTRGATLARVQVGALSAVKTYDPPLTQLAGATVTAVRRIGKFLDWQLVTPDGDRLHLVLHLARAGWIRWAGAPSAAPVKPGRGPLALRLSFANPDGSELGTLDVTEAGTHKKLAAYVVRDVGDIAGVARLGPDPLAASFTPDALARTLAAAGGRQLKGVMCDQMVVAGIGNAYSDEILHVARLSPFAPAGRLTEPEQQRLYAAIRDVLGDAIARASSQQPDTLKAEKKAAMRVHGRTGEQCPQCGDVVREVSFADSSLQYCATCQTGGKVLADRRRSRLLK